MLEEILYCLQLEQLLRTLPASVIIVSGYVVDNEWLLLVNCMVHYISTICIV